MRAIWLDDEFDSISETMLHLYFNNIKVEYTPTADEAKRRLKSNKYDVAIIDYDLGQVKSGVDFIREVERFHKSTLFLMITQFPEQAHEKSTELKIKSAIEGKQSILVSPYDQKSSKLLSLIIAGVSQKRKWLNRLKIAFRAADRSLFSWSNLHTLSSAYGVKAMGAVVTVLMVFGFLFGHTEFVDNILIKIIQKSWVEIVGYISILASFFIVSIYAPSIIRSYKSFEPFYNYCLVIFDVENDRRKISEGALSVDPAIKLSDRFLLIEGYWKFANEHPKLPRWIAVLFLTTGFSLIAVSAVMAFIGR